MLKKMGFPKGMPFGGLLRAEPLKVYVGKRLKMEDIACESGIEKRMVASADEDGKSGSSLEGLEAAETVFEADDPVALLAMELNSAQITFGIGFGCEVFFAGDPEGDGLKDWMLGADGLDVDERRVSDNDVADVCGGKRVE